MKAHRLSIIIKKQIRKEIFRYLKKIDSLQSDIVNKQYSAVSLPQVNSLTESEIDKILEPLLTVMFDRRLLAGGLPIKLEDNLDVFIHEAVGAFGKDNIIDVPSTTITLTPYSEDRWAYIYLNSLGEYEVNKYPPYIGNNTEKIPICKIWLEKNATTWDYALLRDLRQVGVASGALNHIIRQLMINLMQSIVPSLTKYLEIIPYTESGNSNLYVKVTTFNNNILFGRLTPLADSKIEIPTPSVVTSYIIIAKATINNDDPDDLKFEYAVKEKGEVIEDYEIPIALISDVTPSQTEISENQIKVIGIQKKKEDYYTNIYHFIDYSAIINKLLVNETANRINSRRYSTTYPFIRNSLKVYLNGIKERKSDITIVSDTEFEFYDDREIDDIVEVEYLRNDL